MRALRFRASTPTSEVIAELPPPIVPDPYVRPADWLELPTLVPGDKKFVGLFAVYDQASNPVQLQCTTNGGSFTVDWGDGVVENKASMSAATHDYTYANIPDSTTSVHGYRQVIITVTPTLAATLIRQLHFSAANWVTYAANWLDMRMASADMTSVTISSSASRPDDQKMFPLLERFEFIGTNQLTNQSYMFNEWCPQLQSVTINLSTATNLAYLFNGCVNLREVNVGATPLCTSLAYAFAGCRLLQRIDLDNTSACTDFSGLFSGVTALRYYTVPDTSKGTAFVSMFASCSQLTEQPRVDYSKATTVSGMFAACQFRTATVEPAPACTDYSMMFNGCARLETVASVSISAVANKLDQMFSFCSNLRYIPPMSAGTNTASSMFTSCISLTTLPAIDLSAVKSPSSMFSGCYSIREVPDLNMPVATNLSGMFNNCYALRTVGTLSTPMATNFTQMFYNCRLLTKGPAIDTAKATTLQQMFYGCTAMTSVAPMVTSNVTTFENTFYGCKNLRAVPELDTSKATSLYYTFHQCRSLRYLPPVLNTLKVTTLFNTFNECASLPELPAMNLPLVTTTTGAFTYCVSVRRAPLTGIAVSFELYGANLDAAALNELYTGLPTVTGKSLAVQANPGIGGDNPAIATAKGWTITGS